MLAMEQGTGKTKVIIDNAAFLHMRGDLGAVIVIAPMGADKNWISDEVPTHMTEALTWDGMLFRSGKADTKAWQARWDAMLRDRDVFPWLFMNIEAVQTDAGYAAAQQLLRKHKTMLVVDESNIIASPSALQARTVRRLGALADYRRTLDGTPGTESPFHLYGQYNFLDKRILRGETFSQFKNRYGIWERVYFKGQDDVPEADRKFFPSLIQYKDLEELHARIAPYTFRVLKDDVLDLPPKVYRKRYFPLPPEQRKVYETLKREYMAEVQGRFIEAELPITRAIRLAQVASGFLPSNEEEPEVMIKGPQPRYDVTLSEWKNYPVRTIVWARFRMERDRLETMFTEAGAVVGRYDGQTGSDERDHNKEDFARADGKIQVMICSEAAARSLTWVQTRHNIYHSNFLRVLHRIQSEDRSHRAGLKHSQLYTDVVAEKTVNEDLLQSYREKKADADVVHKDPTKEWI